MSTPAQTNTIQIYGPSFSTFVKTVEICCRYKELPYHTGFSINNQTVEFASEQHLALHPFAKLPVLIDGDINVAETQAILKYLENAYLESSLWPEALAQQTIVDSWASLLVCYVDSVLVRQYLLPIKKGRDKEQPEYFQQALAKQDDVLEVLAKLTKQLGSNNYLCGDRFTVADAILLPMLDYIAKLEQPFAVLANQPVLLEYYQRINQLPFCRL